MRGEEQDFIPYLHESVFPLPLFWNLSVRSVMLIDKKKPVWRSVCSLHIVFHVCPTPYTLTFLVGMGNYWLLTTFDSVGCRDKSEFRRLIVRYNSSSGECESIALEVYSNERFSSESVGQDTSV
jgi:hypothetical protein